ncbi:cytochrome b5 [Diabrotica virgifera virgifera]|uniref:Cytochrome b5-like n=1 Tax=Diabrotica virgifera virgifera TaxID=50390 RepID=A0A6P7FD85_DIAVI|nr:cytochrome b5 [Diabrotica virgifera virgifera]
MAKVASTIFSVFSFSAPRPVRVQFADSSGLTVSGLPGERVITLEEVSRHDTDKDCWVVIYDRVYDITEFLDEHPGGSEVLLEYAGREASAAFRGSGHSNVAIKLLNKYCIGELPIDERIFRKPGGLMLSNIPE